MIWRALSEWDSEMRNNCHRAIFRMVVMRKSRAKHGEHGKSTFDLTLGDLFALDPVLARTMTKGTLR
jgi:hypothetical protein